MAKNRCARQYTPEMVIKLLVGKELTLRQIWEGINCSKSTAEELVNQLEADGIIQKRNIRTENNPLWMHSLVRHEHE